MVLGIILPAENEILKELEQYRRPSDLVLAYSGNFKVPWKAPKLAEHGYFNQ